LNHATKSSGSRLAGHLDAGKWEAKLGLIVPSWNTVNEFEFQRVLPESISCHVTRIKITADDEENFARMATEVPAAAQLLAQAKVDAICYGCLAGGLVQGPGHDLEIVEAITDVTGIPGVTAAEAVIRGLQALKVTRVSVASPYEPWLNEKLKSYLYSFGVEVVAMRGLGTQAHASFTPEKNAELASEVDRSESQAIFISCSNFRTLEIIDLLEKKLQKPVLTSNMCSLWRMLRLIGNRRVLPDCGRLFVEA
jgi:maleate isomerase